MTTKSKYTEKQVEAITGGWRLYNAAIEALEEAEHHFDELDSEHEIDCGKAQRALSAAHMRLDTAYSEGASILPGGDW